MSVAERSYCRDSNELLKRLKRPLRLVIDMMLEGFNYDEFIDTFKECFPGCWQAVLEFKKEHDRLYYDINRI